MKKFLLISSIIAFALVSDHFFSRLTISGAPPNGIPETEVPSDLNQNYWLQSWARPDGPPIVGIQVGHWQTASAPDELKNIRNNFGASAGGVDEIDINMSVANKLATLLRDDGVEVDILPVTIPPGYYADVFISIHADGSTNVDKSGYKFAGPWRDLTGDSKELVSLLESSYGESIPLEIDPNITRNMRGYYAFSWWRYKHAIHPMTTAVIAELGFVTHPTDRKILVNNVEDIANALSLGISTYLKDKGLL